MKHSVDEIVLNNGARGLLVHIPGATVMTFDFDFRAGEYLMDKEKWETPHMMEHMLLGSNQKFPKSKAFQAEFEKNGAYWNASTNSYDINYEAECADFEWKRILNLLVLAMTRPLFSEEEFKAEAGNIREELTARSNNHFRHLSLALRQAYGFTVLTDQERLLVMDNVNLTDIKQHYNATHTASNLRFVIGGKIPPNRQNHILKMLNNIELPSGIGRLELPDERPVRINKPLYIHNETVKNLYFYLDTFSEQRLDDYHLDALSLINSTLTETLYSRILGTAREHGLVYSMSSNFSHTKNSTNWWFGAQVRQDNVKPLFKIMVNEMQKVFDGQLTNKDIASAKQYALGKHQRSAQTVAGTSGGYSGRYFFDGMIEDYYQIPARIKAVTKPAIVASTNALFEKKIWGLGVLGTGDEQLVQKLHRQLKPLWS